MLPEKADQMLRDYNVTLGRCEHLRTILPELEKEARIWRKALAADIARSSENDLDGMPRGNRVGNPTERLGIMLASGFTPDGLKELEGEIARYSQELREKELHIHFVEAWLRGLNDRERWIITRQVIDGAYWRQIVAEFRERYGEEYTREGLKRIKVCALDKIHKMAA